MNESVTFEEIHGNRWEMYIFREQCEMLEGGTQHK